MSDTVARGSRAAAVTLAAGLAGIAAFQLFWALGWTWGLHAASGGAYEDATTGLRAASLAAGLVLLGAALIPLARVGLWAAPVPARAVRAATWTLTAALVLGALVNVGAPTAWERWGNGSIAAVLALLALVVARSGAPVRRRARPPARALTTR